MCSNALARQRSEDSHEAPAHALGVVRDDDDVDVVGHQRHRDGLGEGGAEVDPEPACGRIVSEQDAATATEESMLSAAHGLNEVPA